MLHDRIEGRQHLPHTGGQRDLARLACAPQPLIERLDHRIAPDRRHGGHVQDGSDVAPPPADPAAPSPGAAITIQRRHADQSGDRAAVERTQFRQLGQQRPADNGADARHALQQVIVLAPEGTAADLLIQVGIEAATRSSNHCT